MSFPWVEIATTNAVFAGNILSPGPNVFNTIAIAIGSGRKVAMAVVPAIFIGVTIWASAAILGAAVLFREAPWIEPVLGGIGGALLIWFASRYLRQALRWQAETAGARTIAPRTAFLVTLGVLATNPKALTTWLVLITIFPAGTASDTAIVVMIVSAAITAALGHTAYALAFSTRRAAAAYARAGRWITLGVGLFFAAFGASLLVGMVRAFL